VKSKQYSKSWYNLPAGRQVSLVFSTILLQLIVFFLPSQLGLHFWPEFSRAAGIKIDYLSPTLYFTDLLIIAFIALNLKIILIWLKNYKFEVVFLLVYVFLNSFYGVSPSNSFFWWGRVLLYLLFILTLRLRKVTWLHIKNPLIISTLLVVSLEMFQLFHQSSFGGLFYWLGERAFSSSTSGLARLSLGGVDFVRPPSVFSHPNSLAGYLLVVYYLLHLRRSALWCRLFVFLGLLFTFSKGALLAFLLIFTFPFNSYLILAFFLTFSLLQPFLPNLLSSLQFVSDRLFLLVPSRKIIFLSPLLGVGLGNFVPSLIRFLPGSFLLPEKLQPVHNLPVLLVSEIGFVGLALLILLIRKHYRKILNPQFLTLVVIIIITGSFDHYWWTLPQNKLILLLAGAILL